MYVFKCGVTKSLSDSQLAPVVSFSTKLIIISLVAVVVFASLYFLTC